MKASEYKAKSKLLKMYEARPVLNSHECTVMEHLSKQIAAEDIAVAITKSNARQSEFYRKHENEPWFDSED